MELSIFEKSFNSFGGTWIFQPLQAVFESGENCFGTALKEIELQISFASEFPFDQQGVNRSLENLFVEYHDDLSKLPKRSFFRKKQTLSIAFQSDFIFAEQFFPRSKEAYRIRNETFFYDLNLKLLDHLIKETRACCSKFKKSDDLNFDSLVAWMKTLSDILPADKSSADKLVEKWKKKKSDAFEQLSDWEKLDLDWDDFHPDARELISEPRLWDIAHDFSPNGNDTGADILEMVREIRNKKPLLRDGGEKFYESTWEEWGFSKPSRIWPDDSTDYNVHRELIIGLAFSFIKLTGECPDWTKKRAIEETTAYIRYLETGELKWPHRDECLEYQNLILNALDNL